MVYLPGRRIVTLISLADTPFSSSSSPSFSLILVLSESIESGLASGPNLKITSTIDLPSGKHLKKKGENRQLLNQKNNNSIIQYVDDSFTLLCSQLAELKGSLLGSNERSVKELTNQQNVKTKIVSAFVFLF